MPHHKAYVAGVKFRAGSGEHMAIREDDGKWLLQPEPTNQHDPHAVKVLHDGFHVGYVPRELSREVAALIADGRHTHIVKRPGNAIEIHFKPREQVHG